MLYASLLDTEPRNHGWHKNQNVAARRSVLVFYRPPSRGHAFESLAQWRMGTFISHNGGQPQLLMLVRGGHWLALDVASTGVGTDDMWVM